MITALYTSNWSEFIRKLAPEFSYYSVLLAGMEEKRKVLTLYSLVRNCCFIVMLLFLFDTKSFIDNDDSV